ncbi:cyclopropane-fatty-acyl-phospholipid synthase family protein [Novosphingobium sp. CCH12-A3]|uniref:SAM-dependent methyltransferase n=1 Tax=Novosphingobium sp. CCH12-A3 TaxID=1768752 RepID=UPI0007830FFE|nr:cyclopropane-fatty-acyl-phospholipid synthase family protein [Novosphingobium sp. CCH12-A3]
MSLLAPLISLVERAPLPDALTRAGVSFMCEKRRRAVHRDRPDDARFAAWMAQRPVAEHTEAANEQHYELPPRFFELSLGPNAKYSCCLYPTGNETLEQAELAALSATMELAALEDGQHILELGCGWGSLSLTMAARFPNARITAVSNSRPQGEHIRAKAEARGLSNLTVLTADMNAFAPEGQFDRVVSVEMFEHMANWRELLARVKTWLRPDGRLFLHVFSHRQYPYRFDTADKSSWIAQYFFTGGIMPSHALIGQFDDLFALEREWWWDGTHYEKTARHWLALFDAKAAEIEPVLRQVYGGDTPLWMRRWRLFYLATAGLFGHRGGREWGVSHWLLRPV